MSRPSVYPSSSSQDLLFLNHLDDCANYTEISAFKLNDSLKKFQPGIKDLSRLTKILTNKHHYLLLPTPQIQAYQSTLSTSLAPQIESLISKAENLIQSQSKRVENLEERLKIVESAQIQKKKVKPLSSNGFKNIEDELEGLGCGVGGEGKGGERVDDGHVGEGGGEGSRLDGIDMKELTVAQRRKIIMLRGKRDRLEREKAELMG